MLPKIQFALYFLWFCAAKSSYLIEQVFRNEIPDTCFNGGVYYTVGESFANDQCSHWCKCRARNEVVCSSLCPPAGIECTQGMLTKFDYLPVAKTPCNCKIQRCTELDGCPLRNQSYMFGQHSDGRWQVVEVEPGGVLGGAVNNGSWNYFYDVQLSYRVDCRLYLFRHSTQTRKWFVRELYKGGRISDILYSGLWTLAYHVVVPYTVQNSQFIYAQSLDSDRWFIREVLSNGRIGDETASGFWIDPYEVQFTYKTEGVRYLFGHNIEKGTWFTQQLLSAGKMGEQIQSGSLGESCNILLPFQVEREQFVYGYSAGSGKWFIRRLLPLGRLSAKETDSGTEEGFYSRQVVFQSDGRQYLYMWSGDQGLVKELEEGGRMGNVEVRQQNPIPMFLQYFV